MYVFLAKVQGIIENKGLISKTNDKKKNSKRTRRPAHAIVRKYRCPFGGCIKAYGTEGALKFHIKSKHRDEQMPAIRPIEPLNETLSSPNDIVPPMVLHPPFHRPPNTNLSNRPSNLSISGGSPSINRGANHENINTSNNINMKPPDGMNGTDINNGQSNSLPPLHYNLPFDVMNQQIMPQLLHGDHLLDGKDMDNDLHLPPLLLPPIPMNGALFKDSTVGVYHS